MEPKSLTRKGGRGNAIILLHGWNSSRKQWLLNLKALAAPLRVIAPRPPGFGESEENTAFPIRGMEWPPSWSLQARPPHATLPPAGHSMGGCIAIRYAVQYPDMVKKTDPRFSPHTQRQPRFARDRSRGGMSSARHLWFS